MPYSSEEVDMADNPFNQFGQDVQAPYLSTSTPSSCGYSNSALPNASPTLVEYHIMNAYFPMQYDDINSPVIEELCDEASSKFTDASLMDTSQHLDRYEGTFAKSSGCFNLCSQHVDLDKIAKFEKWEPPPTVQVRNETREVSAGHGSSSLSFQESYQQWPRIGYWGHSCHSLAASDGTKFRGHSEFYSPSEILQLKRRRSSSGDEPAQDFLNDADLELKLERASRDYFNSDKSSPQTSRTEHSSSASKSSSPVTSILEAKPKPLTKASHSLIERKYRDSINSRIVLLDQTLASTRKSKIDNKAGGKIVPGISRKADVLNGAMRYVKQAELESEARIQEVDFLRLRVVALEKLVGCGDCSLLKRFAGSKIT